MSEILKKVTALPHQYPVIRGMVSYAIIWPVCSVTQEYLDHGTPLSKADWSRAARFSIFGAFFMTPVFYNWLKFNNRIFKSKTLANCLKRSAVEQVSFSPIALTYFFFGMSVLEGKPLEACKNEVRTKVWPTYKLGLMFWPAAQTINFYFVSEKNRIVFASFLSFIWTIYLARVKSKSMQLSQTKED